MLCLRRRNIQILRKLNLFFRLASGSRYFNKCDADRSEIGVLNPNIAGLFAGLKAIHEEEYFEQQQNDLIRKFKARNISLDEFHAKQIKAIRKHVQIVENRKRWKD